MPRPPGNYPGYPGHGHGGYYYPRYGYGWGYYPFYGYYGAFYGPWWGWGWGYPWYGYGYGYGPYGPYYYVDNTCAVRLQVTPREAEVYVDGSLAGIVDEFDGNFQRLRLPPGEHEIEIYLQGYKSIRQKLMLTAGNTIKVKAALQPLAPGEPQDPKPVPMTPPPSAMPQPQTQLPERGAPVEGAWPGPRVTPPSAPVSSNFGTVAIRVQPAGAEVFIDGERWQSPDGQQKLFVEVAEGQHRVEIRKDGYQNFIADVQVRRGEVVPLNVSLPARD